jgi:hypothetical protein
MGMERAFGELGTERTKYIVATMEMAMIRKGQMRDQLSLASALIHCRGHDRAVSDWNPYSLRVY